MDKETHTALLKTSRLVNEKLKDPNLTAEEREEMQVKSSAIAGQLLSTWFPVPTANRVLMLCYFIIGCLGFVTAYGWLKYSFLLVLCCSPKLIGIISFLIGAMSRGKQK